MNLKTENLNVSKCKLQDELKAVHLKEDKMKIRRMKKNQLFKKNKKARKENQDPSLVPEISKCQMPKKNNAKKRKRGKQIDHNLRKSHLETKRAIGKKNKPKSPTPLSIESHQFGLPMHLFRAQGPPTHIWEMTSDPTMRY